MAGDQIDCSCKDGDIVPEGNLPGDVMVSILSNLPVKTLLKFRAVSKSWCCLISSPRFIKLHHHRQSVIANYLLMPLDDDDDSRYCKYGLLPPRNHHNKNTSADNDVLILENSPLSKGYSGIIDSCNGLVCALCPKKGLILWNPATRKYRPIECPDDLDYDTVGLCYVDTTNDFKILVWNRCFDARYLFVYSMSSDSWEKFDYYDTGKYPLHIHPPTFVCGHMNWLAHTCKCTSWLAHTCKCTYWCANMIVTYDVTDGAMSCFYLPDNCHSSQYRETLAFRGFLSFVLFPEPQVNEYVLDVWVMEEYGVEGSWVKRFAIRGLSPVTPSILWNDGEIVFICESDNEFSRRLTFYDPCSKSDYYLDFMSLHNYKRQMFNYVESLASVEAE